MAKTLSAHEQPIVKIFSDDYVFRIPDYQRPYSWTTEQAQELFDDLLGFVPANPSSIVDLPSYFLGSIVLIKLDTPFADVVDGQQRLTTLTLLLSTLRSFATGEEKAGLTEYIYEKGNRFAGTVDRFRLTLRERDAKFFQDYVQRDGGFEELLKLETGLDDSRRRIRDNARLFHGRLQAMSQHDRDNLTSFILQKCFLVVVSTSDTDSAFRIFSVLNSRGLDLSATDILKARIIGGISNDQRNAYTKEWETAEADLGRDDFNMLFAHIRTVARKAKAKETLLKEFVEFVPEVATPTKFIDDLLIPMAEAYSEIRASAYAATSHAEQVNEHLRWLNRLEFNDWVPPALAFSVRHRNEPAAMDVFFRSLERLSYFMLVTRYGVNDRIERFAKVTAEIEAGTDLQASSSALQLLPPEQQAFYDALDGAFYNDISVKARIPVLLRLDSLLSDATASYDRDVISVEHVLPQTPPAGSTWLEWFPDPAKRLGIVHRIGNLALLSRKKNSSASNWDFERKKVAYFQHRGVSAFALTTQVLNVPAWSEEVFQSRQKQLMGVLEEHWSLQDRISEADYLLRSL